MVAGGPDAAARLDVEQRRALLWPLLGELPEPVAPAARTVSVEDIDGGRLERLALDLGTGAEVPALLAVPDRRQDEAPGMLYMHAHDYARGKEELVEGRPALQAGPYLPPLMERGIVTLCIDAWCWGERARPDDPARGEHDAFKRLLWVGKVLFGMMVFEQQQALTYLAGRAEVDAHRLGAMGLSMGSTQAWWLAALDERVRLCVDLCCLTDFDALQDHDWLVGHGIYYFVPSLLKHFTSGDVNALIAPRARLSLNGRDDPLTPPEGVERIAKQLHDVYESLGAGDRCHVELFDCGHVETPGMRAIALDWIDRHLVHPASPSTSGG